MPDSFSFLFYLSPLSIIYHHLSLTIVLHIHFVRSNRNMKKYNLYYICSVLLLVLLLKQHPSKAQQAYLNNNKFTCDQDLNITNGYRRNGVETNCQSYFMFRSTTSYYSAASIGSLLSVDASVIAEINSITNSSPSPPSPEPQPWSSSLSAVHARVNTTNKTATTRCRAHPKPI